MNRETWVREKREAGGPFADDTENRGRGCGVPPVCARSGVVYSLPALARGRFGLRQSLVGAQNPPRIQVTVVKAPRTITAGKNPSIDFAILSALRSMRLNRSSGIGIVPWRAPPRAAV